MKLGHGEISEPIPLQQCRCSSHGYFREYPMVVVRHKHYATHVIEGVLAGRAAGRSVESLCDTWGLLDASAPRRWIQQVCRVLKRLTGPLDGVEPSWLLGDRGEADADLRLCTFAELWSLLAGQPRASPMLVRLFPTGVHLALSV